MLGNSMAAVRLKSFRCHVFFGWAGISCNLLGELRVYESFRRDIDIAPFSFGDRRA
jgi:hypothetical protein